MDFALALVAVALAPGLAAVVLTGALFSRLSQPWLFLIVAVLVMYGGYSLAEGTIEFVRATGGILEVAPVGAEQLAAQGLWYLQSRLPALVFACIVGVPTLLALSRRLTR